MTTEKSLKSIVCLLICLSFLPVFISAAGEVVILEVPEEVVVDSEFLVPLSLKVEEEINAFSLIVGYPPDKLDLISLRDNLSQVDIWAQKKSVSQGEVVLEGGFLIPAKDIIKIINLHFKVRAGTVGNVVLKTKEGNVFLADGDATRRPLPDFEVISIVSSGQVKGEEKNGSIFRKDTNIPVISGVEVVRNPLEKENKLILFRARDDGSGIKSTSVRFLRGIKWSNWVEISSPVEMPEWSWFFEIKTVDNSGNESIYRKFVASESINKLVLPLFFLAIIVLFYSFRKSTFKNR